MASKQRTIDVTMKLAPDGRSVSLVIYNEDGLSFSEVIRGLSAARNEVCKLREQAGQSKAQKAKKKK